MKTSLFAGDINFDGKGGKYVEIRKFEYFFKQNGDIFFSPNVL